MAIVISAMCFRTAPKTGAGYGTASIPLRFIPRDEMEAEGYGAYLNQVEDI